MLERLAADTSIITWLMAFVGVLGITAKLVNQLTLCRLVRAAGSMPKSTHRLIKLVRAKYEHACMIRDSVENIDAFVEKYIYEYRGFLFRIHTWRQIEILSAWFAGILAALGALVLYLDSGFSESVYQYIMAGAAEVVLLSVVMRLTDEPYKINAVRMYMTDYLENICTFRLKRQNTREKESIDVIAAENAVKNTAKKTEPALRSVKQTEPVRRTSGLRNEAVLEAAGRGTLAASGSGAGAAEVEELPGRAERERISAGKEGELPINIEGEPRSQERGTAPRHAARQQAAEGRGDDRPALREEAIRQILEEFLA